ncbi:MAG TPA: FAD-binding oxidoreductase [Steroidobacteraceae bacterium]|nr:FAD-binding oxidoreductase [Steroidobacteraceae bacterium]
MPPEIVSSWGNISPSRHFILALPERGASFPQAPQLPSLLPRGNGRSYGDSCLNAEGGLVRMRSLDRFIDFDARSGVLCCEAGVLLADILALAVPRGWFLPVTPGTAFVTVGGAIANDVHGKNHHRAGTFAQAVRAFELLRSDGRWRCTPDENAPLYAATLGGLGLTGLITWAQLQLRPIAGPFMDVHTLRFANLDEFLVRSAESDRDFEYTVAWVDCLGRGRRLGRGVLQCANHAEDPAGSGGQGGAAAVNRRRLTVPFTPPLSLINPASLRLFNTAYYHRHRGGRARVPFDSFFYPLDGLLRWNRLYGPRGFYQYQCVIPEAAGPEPARALLVAIARSGQGSFLAVLKRFGSLSSPGLLSFPQPGLTLALDFPNRGARLERLFRELDAIVASAGGRLYPAKDARMPGMLFRGGYPRWQEFARCIDPRCSSSFWRRVMADAGCV